MVHLEAGRQNLLGLAKDRLPELRCDALRGAAGICPAARGPRLSPVRRLHADVRRHRRPGADRDPDSRQQRREPVRPHVPRVLFWVAIGFGAAAFFKFGIVPVLAVIAVLVGRQHRASRAGANAARSCSASLVEGAQVGAAASASPAPSSASSSASSRSPASRAASASVIVDIGAEQPVPVAVRDHDHLPDPRHGRPDDPELHHHQLHRRPGAAQARRAADRAATCSCSTSASWPT